MKWPPLLAAAGFIAIAIAWLSYESATAEGIAGSSLQEGEAGTSLARAFLASERQVATLGRALSPAAIPATATVFRLRPQTPAAGCDLDDDSPEGDHEPEKTDKKTDKKADKNQDGKTKPEQAKSDPPISPPPKRNNPKNWGRTKDAKAKPKKDERPVPTLDAEERAWVAGGGRLVLALADPWRGLRTSPAGRAEPALPLLPGVRALVGECRSLEGDLIDDAVPAFVASGRPVLVRLSVGRGEVWILGCPQVLENAGLAQGDHLALLSALAGEGRPVWFDERSNGAAGPSGPLAILIGWGLGGALLVFAAALACAAWRRSAVPGPDSPPADAPVRGAVDGVPAVAALYARAMTPQACLELHHARLERLAAIQHGGKAAGKLAMQRLLPNWRPPTRPDPAAFAAALTRLNQTFRSLRHEHPRRRP